MADLYLHHYAGSLFSEKIRVLLGYKQLTWHSVDISPIMPRPLLMPLTGGYRKTPVLQHGADIYCDTRVIATFLERHAPTPALATASPFAADCLAHWADTHLFRTVVAVCFQPKALAVQFGSLTDEQRAAFAADRAELTKGGSGLDPVPPASAEAALAQHLEQLEASLEENFILGNSPGVADFSVYHCLWFVASNSAVAPLLDPFPRVCAWTARMRGFGHGERIDSAAEQALEHATNSTPATPLETKSLLPDGLELGQLVEVRPLDYGRIPVRGSLVTCSSTEIAIRRQDETAGELMVHFPRLGFEITTVA